MVIRHNTLQIQQSNYSPVPFSAVTTGIVVIATSMYVEASRWGLRG